MYRVKRDDQVQVISGKDRGKRGKVRRIFPEDDRLVVEGMNLVKKHMRRSEQNPQGAVVSKESRLPMDRVMPICPKCNRGVRVGFKTLQDGTKQRICRRCQEGF
ncbi:MAG: 50S ribosomal protein L24 [Candidatus Omnitrophica bacterium]|nr:50S ribosomal protein L24 [Candidatus Omnitrophota bacterium]